MSTQRHEEKSTLQGEGGSPLASLFMFSFPLGLRYANWA